jgi:ATP diphosphatase
MLSGVPKTLPALLRAHELAARAATVGFDWTTPGDVLDKMDEEVRELRVAVRDRAVDPAAVEDELGDLFFAMANYARKLGVEPEAALRRAADKFQARFAAMERIATGDGVPLKARTLDEQNALWHRVKAEAAAAASPLPSKETA